MLPSNRSAFPNSCRRFATSLACRRAYPAIRRHDDRSLFPDERANPRSSRSRLVWSGISEIGTAPLASLASSDRSSNGQPAQRASRSPLRSSAVASATVSTSNFEKDSPSLALLRSRAAKAAASTGAPPVQLEISLRAEPSSVVPRRLKDKRKSLQSGSSKQPTVSGVRRKSPRSLMFANPRFCRAHGGDSGFQLQDGGWASARGYAIHPIGFL